MKVIWTPLAIERLQEIDAYISKDSPAAAINFIALLFERVVASWLESLQGSSTITVSAGETITSTDSRFEAILSLLTKKGDQFFGRTQLYSDSSGNMSEEIDRTTGTMTGAQNLTWSHASTLTAYFARQSLGF
jgi:hypothetical protein